MATIFRDHEASTKSKDPAQLKGWRFPLSRYHLWDRHAIGERIEASASVVTPFKRLRKCSLQLFLPETTISSKAIAALRQTDDAVELSKCWSMRQDRRLDLRIVHGAPDADARGISLLDPWSSCVL